MIGFLLFCIPFISIFLFFWPAWFWFKRKQRLLSLLLLIPSALIAAIMIGYFLEPNIDDAGFVVFGMIFYIPPLTFILQLFVVIIYKVIEYIWININTSPKSL